MKKINNQKGFTLIELLIVIALLGALAVGLLAAVDPFEQLKKGRDTSTRNTAAEFYGASIRYYAQRSRFAWDETTTPLATGTVTSLNNLTEAISLMADAGELKEDFVELAGTGNLSRISLYYETSQKLVVCFQPESKSFRNDANTKYNQFGVVQPTSVCPDPNSTSCYYCFK
ncbi:MAG: hypothetical protein KatS3mg091_180 [Patescibacteria group bacterium]|nr:MAG: hypothetical protein KatS3mg091_180 [Patescibacteria group bacterium]